MNWWIVAIVLGVLLVVGVAAVNIFTTTANATEKIPCSSCNGKCSANANCGSATCGALNGGTCGCGSKG